MKGIYLIIVLLLFGQCKSKNKESTLISPASVQREIKTDSEKPFANPALFQGSDFLNFIAQLKLSSPDNLRVLLTYTSKKSKIQYSEKTITELYRKTNFNFNKKLKAISELKDTLFVLNYSCNFYATKSVVSITVSVELDTCRILLPTDNLNDFLK